MIIPRVDAKDGVRAADCAADRTANNSTDRTSCPPPLRGTMLHSRNDPLGMDRGRGREEKCENRVLQEPEHACLLEVSA